VNVIEVFVRRKVATTLLTIGIALTGVLAFPSLPVAPLPQVDYPTILVQAQMPGASPDTMATSVAGPLEKHLEQIADVSEMTSSSTLGLTRITLQFNLSRNIDGAARDVEAAINAARVDLPTSLRSNPTYRKVNPADFPVLILALTSSTLSQGQLYDSAATVLQQRLSQVEGVGEVDLGGSALPAVRVELQPEPIFNYGIGLEDIRAALSSANAHSPKGAIEQGAQHFQLYTNDQANHASDYKALVIAYRNGAPVILSEVADVVDSVEDLRNAGLANGKPSVLVIVYRQPGANIIATVDRVKALLPELSAALPGDVDVTPVTDRTGTIRTSLYDTERTLVIAVVLVTLVVFFFLRNFRATLIPSIAVPISLIGTLGPMYLLGYSLDNLSFMALIVATGFVVDDAIVVLENIARHLEAGMPRFEAAIQGASEVSATVLSISLSLIAVFLPILLMGGLVGRIFREFSIVLAMAILVSLVVSLTATPTMCALFLPRRQSEHHGRIYRFTGWLFDRAQRAYERTLRSAMAHPRLVMLTLLATVGLNVYLFIIVPKGFFPQEDTGRLIGGIQGDQSISFQAMRAKLQQFEAILRQDPAVESTAGFTGGRQTNGGFFFVSLKPLAERKVSADQVIGRLRGRLGQVSGARLFLQAVQDIRVGGRQSNAQYQFTLLGQTSEDIYTWAPRLTRALQRLPELTEVNSDQQQSGLSINVHYERETAARFGLTPSTIDNTLYDAFGQRQVSTIYNPLNQYHVVMEVAPQYWQNPDILRNIYVSTSGSGASATALTNAVAGTVAANSRATTAASLANDSARNQASNSIANSGKGAASSGAAVSTSVETMVPLAAFASYATGNAPLAVNHQNQYVASTLSFNLRPGVSLSQASDLIRKEMDGLQMPASIQGVFSGTAASFQQSLRNEPYLILAAIVAVYIVLGILYESFVHPVTILSTLPSAGVGAVLALMAFNTEFSVIALIGVVLLIGIVKKNAMMMIDVALQAERRGVAPADAMFQACLLRFRPIMMTTFSALLGALPLALGTGEGAELRHPLGISIVGGLLVSQLLTLYTTPIVYLYLDRFRLWLSARRYQGRALPPATAHSARE
jgi:multidrug efflux pump